MKKISVTRNDDVGAVVKKIMAVPDPEIVLIIPKGAKLKDSGAGFEFLKGEAARAGKTLSVESIDDSIRALAEEHGVASLHPLFNAEPARSISDIVPADTQSPATPGKKFKKLSVPESSENGYAAPHVERVAAPEEAAVEEDETADALQERYERPSRRFSARLWVPIVILIVVAAGIWVATSAFGKATVVIAMKKNAWTYAGAITATKTAAQIDAASNTIPGEVVTDSKNITQLFPATGRAGGVTKATGRITIVNAFSTAPQPLVAKTRFATPDGKLFRLDASVTVPGMTAKGASSSVDANVTADQGGPEWNVGPVARLTIPGFSGTPKYEKFYGVLKDGTSGGALQGKAAPSDQDIAQAKDKVAKLLASFFTTAPFASKSNDITVIDGASVVTVTKLTVNKTVDANGNFAVFGEAAVKAIGFREADAKRLLLSHADPNGQGFVFRDISIAYASSTPDFTKGSLQFSVQATGTTAMAFDADTFATSIAGLRVDDVRARIMAIPGLGNGKISLWPLWLGSVPKNADRISVTVQ